MGKGITGHTGLLCLLGSPVAHSISPAMQNEACKQLGLDYAYLAFDVPEEKMPQAVEGLRTMGARGWNITMPGKNIMCKLADKLSPASEISGACNTIVNEDGVLTAYTTDGVGFMRAVKENGVDIIGKKMTLLGAGGAATAILVQAALDGVAEIQVFNIKDAFWERAQDIVNQLNERTTCKVTLHDYEDPEVLRAAIADSAILVNGTSVGMAPKTDATIITDTTMLRPDLFVFDVIYNPKETRLLREAKAAGCKTSNGMYMLLYQGAASFELWTGQEMPVDIIKEKFFISNVKFMEGVSYMNTMPIAEVIDNVAIICKKHGCKRLDLFGSFATGTAVPTSDIDFVVYDCDNITKLEEDLEQIDTLRKIDIFDYNSIHNEFLLEDIRKYGKQIY